MTSRSYSGSPAPACSRRSASSRPGVYPVEVALTNTGQPARSFVTWLDHRRHVGGPRHRQAPARVVDPAGRRESRRSFPTAAADPAVVAQIRAQRPTRSRRDRARATLAAFPFPSSSAPRPSRAGNGSPRRTMHLLPGSHACARRVAMREPRSCRPRTCRSTTPRSKPPDSAIGCRMNSSRAATSSKPCSARRPRRARRTRSSIPVDDAAIDRLRQMLVDQVAVRDTNLVPVTHPFTPAQTFTLATAGGTSRGRNGAVHRATARRPGPAGAEGGSASWRRCPRSRTRLPASPAALVLAEPYAWTPDVAAMTTIMRALRDNPLLAPATLDRLITDVPLEEDQDAPRGAAARFRARPHRRRWIRPSSNGVSNELAAYAGVVGTDDPSVIDGQQALSVALSTTITADRAQAELTKVDDIIQSFTPASHGCQAHHADGSPCQDSAEFPESHQAGAYGQGPRASRKRQAHVSQRRRSSRDVAARQHDDPHSASRPRVRNVPDDDHLTSEDGRLAIGSPVRVTVRSAVFGGLAVGLTVAALLFLAAWWFNHVRRTPPAAPPRLAANVSERQRGGYPAEQRAGPSGPAAEPPRAENMTDDSGGGASDSHDRAPRSRSGRCSRASPGSLASAS